MKKIIFLVSGSGSNMQAVIDNIKNGKLKNTKISLVISNNKNALALKKANIENIPTRLIDANNANVDELLKILKAENPDLIVLAGYMRVLPEKIISSFPKKIINIHPSLIPRHAGKGYYGIKVHESVIKSKDKFSGPTVHFVDKGIDTGKIILQEKIIVPENATAEILQKKVLEVEHKILSKAISICLKN
ncbi:MAG: phosphoribosylglycinamide formyltransferase [Clostridiales Family XIII bacterium]|jgi:phosphoribosylglycinamide formyltransferase-1|nr:phosphoribosylglycinamide formyltransferase [Clostridiales Family XIII bacterium]